MEKTDPRTLKTTDSDGENVATVGAWENAATYGHEAHATTAGDDAFATTFGDQAHATSVGVSAGAATFGPDAHAVALGDYSWASAVGFKSNATATGWGGVARCGHGGSITLTHETKTTRRTVTFRAGLEIEAGVFYTLDRNGWPQVVPELIGWDLTGSALRWEGDRYWYDRVSFPPQVDVEKMVDQLVARGGSRVTLELVRTLVRLNLAGEIGWKPA